MNVELVCSNPVVRIKWKLHRVFFSYLFLLPLYTYSLILCRIVYTLNSERHLSITSLVLEISLLMCDVAWNLIRWIKLFALRIGKFAFVCDADRLDWRSRWLEKDMVAGGNFMQLESWMIFNVGCIMNKLARIVVPGGVFLMWAPPSYLY